ncbi:MAG: V-type ATP synthase subunit D [candidate division KSB1 bacterium]|nr:V-type ATP synthase subunit D [candidate division KSB1 bacterium]MDZ7356849.1 V-type ATP synthase subunit D [candidate division KSB1 bacterium]MDZ7375632.1 V-type ATP synthase subunit D [candidate division KSB1 bacterium]MDZ7401312.1 V-type ATP synthase subunit D [candidate division KSB1 bacterium]
MAKIKYTKNELKKQKDNLKRFTRYLPTLELKKQQLLVEIRQIQNRLEKLTEELDRVTAEVTKWVDVFAEDVDLHEFLQVMEVTTDTENIAGIDIPTFVEVVFLDKEYDLYTTPLWIDRAIAVVKDQIRRQAELKITQRQEEILREELRITIQRIKLFEEVKIPEARENIRVIQIFLGDQMTAEVVRGKIAKAKIEKKKREVSAV